jgi:hypothetical protein
MNKNLLTCVAISFGLYFIITQFDVAVQGLDPDGSNNSMPVNFLNAKANTLDISQPIYQTVVGNFLDTKELSSSPKLVTKESFIEQAIMKDVGNVTNRMTFINTYDSNSTVIQGRGNGTIQIPNGQTIDWISSDIGVTGKKGLEFRGIILFENASSESLSFLSGKMGLYKDAPDTHRTIWLIH